MTDPVSRCIQSESDMQLSHPIFVAGHRGLVGSALVRRLSAGGYSNIITRTRQELDLLDPSAVRSFLMLHRPIYIFMAAAKVGGIHANNTYGADFIYDNLMIEANVVYGAHTAGIERLMFLGSSCIYPRNCPQPIREDYLLTGPLEATNEPYAIAKIAGLKMCEAFNKQYRRQYITVMPTNLYGPNDNFDLANCHVLPALIRKAHEAKARNESEWIVWGTGTPRREFLYIDDFADACVHLMESGYSGPPLNIGVGEDISIRELAELVAEVVGFKGTIRYDATKPDGTPRKLLDISRLRSIGWQAKTSLREGIRTTYENACFYR